MNLNIGTSSTSVSTQTLWTFPPGEFINDCPTPKAESNDLFQPRKFVSEMIDRYENDNMMDEPQHNGSVCIPESSCTSAATSQPVADEVTSSTLSDIPSPSMSSSNKIKTNYTQQQQCQVCSDVAAGFHCGAFVCEACKKFYIRATKQTNKSFTCNSSKQGACDIQKHNRTLCSHCRYQKCLDIGMKPPGKGLLDTHKVTSLPCKVCGSPSSGFHFGVLSCEGCKGFFRRLLNDNGSKAINLACQKGGNCRIDTQSRSQCRACRYHKCVSMGMSKSAARIGRQPNSVRYSRIIENAPDIQDAARLPVKLEQCSDSQQNSLDGVPTEKVQISPPHQESAELMDVESHVITPPVSHPAATSTLHPTIASNVVDEPGKIAAVDLSTTSTTMSHSVISHENYPCMPPGVSSIMPQPVTPAYNLKLSRLCSLWESCVSDYFRTVTDTHVCEGNISDPMFTHWLFHGFTNGLKCYLELLKRIEGFRSLNLDDRVVLTKYSIYRMSLIIASSRYDLETGRHYIFGWRSWSNAKHNLLSVFPEYAATIRHFDVEGRKVKEIGLTTHESALLAILSVINFDHISEIKEPDALAAVYKEYYDMLITHTYANFSDPTHRLQQLKTVLDIGLKVATEHGINAKIVLMKYPSFGAAAARNAAMIPEVYREIYHPE